MSAEGETLRVGAKLMRARGYFLTADEMEATAALIDAEQATVGDMPPDGAFDWLCPVCAETVPITWSGSKGAETTAFELDTSAAQAHKLTHGPDVVGERE